MDTMLKPVEVASRTERKTIEIPMETIQEVARRWREMQVASQGPTLTAQAMEG